MSSKLYELLQGVIQKVNKSVSTDAQQLTEEQKLQVKTNLGISDTTASAIPDWNQNDETAPDYVKNRTHSLEEEIVEILPTTEFTSDTTYFSTQLPCDFIKHDDVVVFIVDGVEYPTTAVTEEKMGHTEADIWVNGSFCITVGNGMGGEDNISVHLLGAETYLGEHASGDLRVLKVNRTYHTLDDKYLPESVARVTDLQKDWNVHDYNDLRYVRNRPCYHKDETSTVICSGYITPSLDNKTVPYSFMKYGKTYEIEVDWTTIGTVTDYIMHPELMGEYIGNLSLRDSQYENTGEDFLIEWGKGDDYSTVYLSDKYSSSDSVYLRLIEIDPEVLQKLDEKFLPDSQVTSDEIQQLADMLK